MAPADEILDVNAFHFGIPEIQRHSQLIPFGLPETIARQKTVLDRWKRDRNEAIERPFWPREKFLAWKIERLSRLVDHAFESTTLYHDLYSRAGFRPGDIQSLDDFARLPSIGRDELIDDFPESVCSRKIDIKSCRWISSSGSTGKPVQMVLEQSRADLDTIHRLRQFELMSGYRLAPEDWIYNVHHSLWWYTSFLGDYRTFSLSQNCPPEAVGRHLARLKPAVISSLASFLPRLAETVGSLRPFGVRLVSSNSETSSRQERETLSRLFEVDVLDEYSSEELGLIAYECRHRRYHACEDETHLEIESADETGLGDVVGTDLWNYAMPVIRYRQGDLGSLGADHSSCACGATFRVLERLHGRADQAFFSSVTGRIAPGGILDACDTYLSADDMGIREYRVVQHAADELEVIAVLRPGVAAPSPSLLDGFGTAVTSLFGYRPRLRVSAVAAIPAEKSYKRRILVNRMRQS